MKVDAKVIADYVAERDEALFSLNEEKIQAFMKKNKIPIPEDKQVFWGSVYKTIANSGNASELLRMRAKKELEKMGMDTSISVPKVRVVKKKAGK